MTKFGKLINPNPINKRRFRKWDGTYRKEIYEVLIPATGEIVRCWPNAGKMGSMSDGRNWKPGADIRVRLAEQD